MEHDVELPENKNIIVDIIALIEIKFWNQIKD